MPRRFGFRSPAGFHAVTHPKRELHLAVKRGRRVHDLLTILLKNLTMFNRTIKHPYQLNNVVSVMPHGMRQVEDVAY